MCSRILPRRKPVNLCRRNAYFSSPVAAGEAPPQAAERALRRIVAAALLALWPAFAGAADSGSPVIAKFGATEFRASDFTTFIRLLDPQLRKQALADKQVMDRLIGLEIARIAVLEEAKAKKWQDHPDVTRQVERAGDDVVLNSYLSSVSALPKGFPSEKDIQSAYDLNRDTFMMPRQYRLAQIFVASPKGAAKPAEDAARKKVDDLLRKLHAPGAKFEDVARAGSEHKSSAAKGGDMGWAAQEQIAPEVRKEVVGMAVGEISDPIRSAAGWHIVKLEDTKPAAPRPLAEVKDTVIAGLKQKKAKETQQAYVSQVLQKSPISVNEAELRKLFEATP
jgi:peptidylprolyl isomerase